MAHPSDASPEPALFSDGAVRRRFISLAYLTVFPLQPPEVVSIAARYGYDGTGLRLQSARDDGSDRPIGGKSMIAETKARLADSGIKLLDVEFFWLRRDRAIEDYRPAIELAAELGATWLLTGGWYEDDELLVERLTSLSTLAQAYSLKVALEFMPWTGIESLDHARALLARAGQPNAALVLDPLHLDRAGSGPADLARLGEEEIAYLQLCDARPDRPRERQHIAQEARFDRLIPGEGSLPLGDFVRALPGHLPVSLEIPTTTPLSEMSIESRAQRGMAATLSLLQAARMNVSA